MKICIKHNSHHLITIRKRSGGNVMFSQACVKDSVHKRGGVSQHALGQTHTPGRHPLPPGRHPLPPWANPPDRPPCPVHAGIHPPPTATAAEGTHPTGMHSCYRICIRLLRERCRFTWMRKLTRNVVGTSLWKPKTLFSR